MHGEHNQRCIFREHVDLFTFVYLTTVSISLDLTQRGFSEFAIILSEESPNKFLSENFTNFCSFEGSIGNKQ